MNMKNFINWLDEHDLLEYVENAVNLVGIVLGVILYIAWVICLVIAGIVIAAGVFMASGWWLLAVIPWLVLVIVTIAAFMWARENI